MATSGRPTHCQYRFNYDANAKFEAQPIDWQLPSYTVLLLIRYVTLWPWQLTLWPWPFNLWPWTFVVYRLCRDQTLCQISAQSSNRSGVIAISIFDLMILNIWHVRVALCSGISFIKFKLLSQTICSWNVTICMLIRHVTLWLDLWPAVTLKVCSRFGIMWS